MRYVGSLSNLSCFCQNLQSYLGHTTMQEVSTILANIWKQRLRSVQCYGYILLQAQSAHAEPTWVFLYTCHVQSQVGVFKPEVLPTHFCAQNTRYVTNFKLILNHPSSDIFPYSNNQKGDTNLMTGTLYYWKILCTFCMHIHTKILFLLALIYSE